MCMNLTKMMHHTNYLQKNIYTNDAIFSNHETRHYELACNVGI